MDRTRAAPDVNFPAGQARPPAGPGQRAKPGPRLAPASGPKCAKSLICIGVVALLVRIPSPLRGCLRRPSGGPPAAADRRRPSGLAQQQPGGAGQQPNQPFGQRMGLAARAAERIKGWVLPVLTRRPSGSGFRAGPVPVLRTALDPFRCAMHWLQAVRPQRPQRPQGSVALGCFGLHTLAFRLLWVALGCTRLLFACSVHPRQKVFNQDAEANALRSGRGQGRSAGPGPDPRGSRCPKGGG